jgi:thiol-disulfide isomerase/thioredoxin
MLTAAFVSLLMSVAPPAATDPAPPAGGATPSATPVLVAGAAAPALSVDAWVKGDEVKAFEPEKVYVVEFWATWCGPCLASIPHLTQIQNENPKDLVVIGVAASEKPDPSMKDASREAIVEKMLEKVKIFVNQQGDRMAYRVAFDGDGTMGREWMRAARQNSIPCTFIIGKDGKVAWIGNPKDMDAPLAKALGKEPPKKKKPKDKPGSIKGDSATGTKPPAPPKGLE